MRRHRGNTERKLALNANLVGILYVIFCGRIGDDFRIVENLYAVERNGGKFKCRVRLFVRLLRRVRFGFNRQFNRNRRAFVFLTANVDCAVVIADDLVND